VNSLDWLLDADPAISWQAMRDLADFSSGGIAQRRARIPREGIGAEILSCQQADGAWRRDGKPVWSSTLFTLLLLRSTGVDRSDPAVETAIARAEANLRWSNQPHWDLRGVESGGNPFFAGEVEPCINGGVLALGAYFGRPTESLARRLLSEQLADGGWNCEAPKSTRSSFHTTICVLEGLLEYEHAAGSAPEIAAARQRGQEYLLTRALFRRLSTGEVANAEFLELAFPPRYHYDILRALDYFRSAGLPPGARIREAVQWIESRRGAGGQWRLDRAYDEVLAVPFHESPGDPSRWITLRALRVLRWYDEEAGTQPAS
jgi:hypothetical protein